MASKATTVALPLVWPLVPWPHRHPELPSSRQLAFALATEVLGSMLMLMGVQALSVPGVRLPELFSWGALSALALGLASLALGALQVLRPWALARLSPGQHWGLGWAMVTACALLGGGGRHLLGLELIPAFFTPETGLRLGLSVVFLAWCNFLGLEAITHLQRRHERLLLQKQLLHERLMNLRRGLIEENDRQRQALAEWLHGRMQSLLYGAWVQLKQSELQAEPARSASLLGAHSKLELALAEVERTGHAGGLRWGEFQPKALPLRLAELARVLDGLVELRLRPGGWPEGGPLRAPGLEDLALLLVEELLLNAAKHHQRPQVELQLQGRADGPWRLALQGRALRLPPREGGGLGSVLASQLEASGLGVEALPEGGVAIVWPPSAWEARDGLA